MLQRGTALLIWVKSAARSNPVVHAMLDGDDAELTFQVAHLAGAQFVSLRRRRGLRAWPEVAVMPVPPKTDPSRKDSNCSAVHRIPYHVEA